MKRYFHYHQHCVWIRDTLHLGIATSPLTEVKGQVGLQTLCQLTNLFKHDIGIARQRLFAAGTDRD